MLLADLSFTIVSLQKYYASGGLPTLVIEELYKRLDKVGDPGIFITLHDKNNMLEQARQLGENPDPHSLWGIPYAVKDNIDCYDAPTTAGCPDYAYMPRKDAFVVDLLRRQGALCVGKTNLDQFATGLVGTRSPYTPPTNALDPVLVPGGSSSGSGVVVAHGIVSFALGTDTAGSGRVPAAMNNIVGLKPTLGSLSASGLVPACKTLDTISIFALTVYDAALVHTCLSQYDPLDAYSRVLPAPRADVAMSKPRIATPQSDSLTFFDDDHQCAHKCALATIEQHGINISKFDYQPFADIANLLYGGAWVAERYAAIRDVITTRPQTLHPITREIIEGAARLSAADAFDSMYRLKTLKRLVEPLLESIDVMILPSVPAMFTLEHVDNDPIDTNNQLGMYTNFVNLLDLCALTIPFGLRDDGLPYSLTLVSQAGNDQLLAQQGQYFVSMCPNKLGATAWTDDDCPPLPVFDSSTRSDTDRLTIAVCGAHMSSLALNYQLTDVDGRFECATRTAPDYQFFALAGGPPHRPGLVRKASGQGVSVDVELWSIPITQVGRFMRNVPDPLGIGHVRLENGESSLGFLCEVAGVEGAEDISHHRSWRVFLDA